MRIFLNYPSCRGFTLIELMMVVAVTAVLLGLAVPSFNALMERQRLVATQNHLMAGFHYARSLAVSTHAQAVICPSSDGLNCQTGGVWDSGWMIYVDRNRNGRRDADEAPQRVERQPSGLRVRSSASRPQAVFRPNGGSGASNLTLRLCSESGQALGTLVLNNSGRLRKTVAADASGRCT
ncbi:GspH/FimT family pseudopilin [Aquimonas sp.]|jgi:type IV fimbrial biogenesis protein FimT|uniref:GspH/FimT family pseudopilin n=1 Tax=Aquimonas sp. TaxID=1872588 RepID=UPI0037BF1EDA